MCLESSSLMASMLPMVMAALEMVRRVMEALLALAPPLLLALVPPPLLALALAPPLLLTEYENLKMLRALLRICRLAPVVSQSMTCMFCRSTLASPARK